LALSAERFHCSGLYTHQTTDISEIKVYLYHMLLTIR